MNNFINFLKDLRQKSLEMEIPALPESSAKFLSMITYIYPQKNIKIVELGSGIGYSMLWMLYGILNSGKKAGIYGVEREEKNIKKGIEILEQAGKILNLNLKEYITFYKADSRNLKGSEFGDNIDILFLDINKRGYLPSFLKFKPYMKKNGIVIAHNVFSHKEELSDFLKEINKEEYFTTYLETDPQGISITFLK